ncbi:formylglycine-generating enzyme family protein, partial [bacterium]|nr:formylglycine-generating enzyme family protein [bacterium]
MDPGDYTVTWGDVDDWTTPAPAVVTLTLDQGEGLRFTATWVSEEGSSITFKPIVPGTFLMGSPRGETGSSSYEWPQHRVTLTRPFEMAETEITWEQYVNLMGNNPSFYDDVCLTCPGDYPMESVSWLQAVEFCNALSLAEGYTPAYTVAGATVTWDQGADGYRLPTEAEWEYACRAGTITALSNGDLTSAAASCYSDPNLELIAWYCNNSSSHVHPAGDKQPNEWGLRDMHGNVWEWVWDFSRNYESISLQLGDFTFPDGTVQQRGTITVMEAETGFGTEKILRLDQIGATFGVSNLGVTSSQVSFHYADFDSVTNFRVNGQTLYRGMFSELPGTV